ncbi:heme A synthase [Nocardioides mangrovicus]|uniref:Heme A synthase n=1 Tax=Nocardioides mangrovicus TaxID=2478913 RepID=A0A3L8P487_9ACTN|nr:COX15/CtaA family protein [Nocardioides mangrovicus]RLV49359.1 heme A synthase [Nocardioides mangrovicus]
MQTVLERPGADLRDRWVRPLGWASLVANVVIVVTGGAVRLTDSGLGCPTWPRCTDSSLVPHGAYSVHQAIEFGNRTLTFVLTAVALATLVGVFRSSRRDLRGLSVVLVLGIPLQAVIGGISVHTDLNPWVVSLHLLLSMALVGVATLLLWREAVPAPSHPTGRVATLAAAGFVVAWAVLYVGTVVTGAGPHAGDLHAPRNGLSAMEISRVHSGLVWLLVALTVALLVLLRGTVARRAVTTLLCVELAQGVVGYVQYATDLPVPLVLVHMLGAAVTSSVVTWTLLAARRAATDPTPTG